MIAFWTLKQEHRGVEADMAARRVPSMSFGIILDSTFNHFGGM
jgi:hypothetical protein